LFVAFSINQKNAAEVEHVPSKNALLKRFTMVVNAIR